MWLVVGLGNPGKEYANHRHNVGFMVLEELGRRTRADSFREKFSGLYAKASHAGEEAVLLMPQTFMNLSGQSVQPAAAFFKVQPANVIVVHDELDLAFDDVRLKLGGGHARHNGLRSIMKCLGTGDFGRVRVGIGRPPATFRGEVADWVLSPFDSVERAMMPDVIGRAADSVLDVLARGLTAAMNKLNTRASAGLKKAATPRSGAPSETKEIATGAASPRGTKA
ncbi:MAG: aminoacyl-tRNA hydrolase [Polyangiaceae bacterium]